MTLKTCVFVTLIMVLPWGCSRLGSDPRTVVERYYRSLASGRTDEAAGYMYSKTRSEQPASQLEAQLKEASLRIRQRQGISSIGIKNRIPIEEAQNEVVVDVDIAYGNGSKEGLAISLVQERGNWRIGGQQGVGTIWTPTK
jgi:hypothetical protein